MRVLLQRASEARVEVDGVVLGEIATGLVVFLGVMCEDDEGDAAYLVDKLLGLRIFADDARPMNRSVLDVGGGVLLISQFTLAADTSRGRRPGFSRAAPPEDAERLYEHFAALLRQRVSPVATGRFGAHMRVALVNDGPVTILLDSRDRAAR